ncbi:lipocalin-like domain-containing protein [uncultured Aquimarina sp.]|uniref:lipocalin family protein n=1 Tax=uncultured Aquimarina sp. TaxID=575652 RepID=UPI00263898FF|nr:lipocalin family protein [uncultured Aquimarina sp.]
MKKIILLFAAISTVLISCQSDDDAGPSDTQDKFIGVWKIIQEFEDGVEVTLDACDLEDTLTVTDDQKFSGTSHDEQNGTCTLQGTLTGGWENLGNNIYKITPDLPEAEEIEATITFSGNTMTIVTNDEDGELKEVLTRS